jgi:transketolase
VVITAENRAAIRNLPPKIGARFIDVGISEMTMIGLAAGMALRGRIPLVHALSTFLTLRAFEFIRTDVGIPSLPVKIVGGVPGFLSEANGPTHQAIEDIALMRGIPNMGIFAPADGKELIAGLPSIIESNQPFYIRYNACEPVVEHHEAFAIGRAEMFGSGTDVSILTYGFLLGEAMKAAELLEAEGISTRVVNLRTVSPVDHDTVMAAVNETELVVTFEDHFKTGGLHSILAEMLLEARQTANVLPIALDGRWFTPALLADVLETEGYTGRQVADRIIKERGRVANPVA